MPILLQGWSCFISLRKFFAGAARLHGCGRNRRMFYDTGSLRHVGWGYLEDVGGEYLYLGRLCVMVIAQR